MAKRIPSEKERVLNPIVERHRLCGPNQVGQVSDLVTSSSFKNKDEWEKFYFDSGEKRKKILEEKTKILKKTELKKLTSELNKKHGRTSKELDEKAKKLFEFLPEEKNRLEKSLIELNKIKLEDCQECIKQYVIDNTWEGIVKRENSVVNKLIKNGFKKIEKTIGDVDTKLGVDREIFSADGKKKVGIQIKPLNSRGSALIDAHNKSAQSKYESKVITIFSDTKGKIKDEEKIINEIKKELEN